MINDILKLKNRKPQISGMSNYIRSSVIIPIINNQNILSILFEVRSKKLKQQPNEICFPGGGIEKGENELMAAIRETSEELCINADNINIIGSSDTLITPFNYIIYAYIGLLNNYEYTFNREVSEIFTVPLSFFLANKPLIYNIDVNMKPDDSFPYHLIQDGKNYKWGQGEYPVYFYIYKDRIIWGITAKILFDFISLVKKHN